ncbi:hypothetical protein M5689_018977 [Euphorbia peplus]|nr:hypothetical protein M5689_018977 [Euphorbia peplus]
MLVRAKNEQKKTFEFIQVHARPCEEVTCKLKLENRRNNSRRATYRSRARGKDCLWRAGCFLSLVSTEAILASGAPGYRKFKIDFLRRSYPHNPSERSYAFPTDTTIP